MTQRLSKHIYIFFFVLQKLYNIINYKQYYKHTKFEKCVIKADIKKKIHNFEKK